MRGTVDNFSLRHIHAFITVVEAGGIAPASVQLRRSHSAVSRSLALVEERFGAALLLRSPTGVAPTRAGCFCEARCRAIESELSDLKDLLVHAGNPELSGRITSLFQIKIDISRLKAIAAVCDFGSVQSAACFLNVSQPAISSLVRNLEKDLGIELFVRTPSGMITTPMGLATNRTFKRVLSELRKIEDDIASIDNIAAGLVSIGGLAFSRNALLPKAIKNLRREYPNITVRTVEGPITALLSALHAGELDMVIAARPHRALVEGLIVERLVEDSIGLFVAREHPLAGYRSVGVEQVLRYPFILPPFGTATRALMKRAFRETGVDEPAGMVETSSRNVIRSLLIGSEQISFRSVTEFSGDLEDGAIVQLDLDFEIPQREICVLQRKNVLATKAVSEVLAAVRAVAAAL